jgi:hypothetical protein
MQLQQILTFIPPKKRKKSYEKKTILISFKDKSVLELKKKSYE